MDIWMRLTGVLLCGVFRCTSCTQVYFQEYPLLRNYHAVPGSDSLTSMTPTLQDCIISCAMTQDCYFISYVNVTSMCIRHRYWYGQQAQSSAAVWFIVGEHKCPLGWHRFESSCYLFANVSLTWTESSNFCKLFGARLVSVESEREDKMLRAHGYTIQYKQRFWTDGSDITEEGKWVWMTSGMPVENYTNWGSSQPDNGSGAVLPSNCLCLGRWMEFQWDDNPCSEAGLVLCEKPDV